MALKPLKDCKWEVTILSTRSTPFRWWWSAEPKQEQDIEVAGILNMIGVGMYDTEEDCKKSWHMFARFNMITDANYSFI